MVGVSCDPLEKLEPFAVEHKLAFPLVSDERREIAEAWGVLKDNVSRTTERSTAVIGNHGRIVLAYRNVRAKGHAQKVLDDVRHAREGGRL